MKTKQVRFDSIMKIFKIYKIVESLAQDIHKLKLHSENIKHNICNNLKLKSCKQKE